ncbi:hypothetical protein NP493_1359g00029 [Ridgeia piscesae]|uniref:CAP-Gly domain-containing protein n=1 Tax=Ridgeia piscesae TaxID=27915 RepID=A0AAD9K7N2_RIDPI|nr:hypothetical protein NP493_1359g00029 [Ridgeia piscesae]
MSQKPSGLKAPSKISKPTGLPQPKSGSSIPTSGSSIPTEGALEKSVRAAGLPSKFAEHYASEVLKKFPGPELSAPQDPADGYKIGDRVWVGGSKPGVIAYIGETQFAPGEWAGVVLGDAVGKNDGSVAGVRYFQCELKHGVFSRLTKLSREPSSAASSLSPPESTTQQMAPVRLPSSNGMMALPGVDNTTKVRSISGASYSSVGHMRLNDRVLVGGTKTGVLRYLGPTDFAKGEWAGVELDEALGKNDGAVAGKRYFQCVHLFGLFAPVSKVVKAPMATNTPSARRASLNKCSLSALGGAARSRSGSQESISSIGSTASSVSGRGRVRLGVVSLGNQTPSRPTKTRTTSLGLSATSGLQKALKEKEEHVEQLLRERDLERSEVARAAAQVDKAEGELMTVRTEHERFVEERDAEKARLQSLVDQLTNEKRDVAALLEEEKR